MKKIILIVIVVLSLVFLVSCGGEKTVSADLPKLISDIEAGVELPAGMEDISANDLQRLYNISSSEYSQFAGKITSIDRKSVV